MTGRTRRILALLSPRRRRWAAGRTVGDVLPTAPSTLTLRSTPHE